MFYTHIISLSEDDTAYAAAPSLQELKNAEQIRVSAGTAPEVFYFEPKHQWFLIRNGIGYSYLQPDAKLGPTGWIDGHSLCNNIPPAKNRPIDPWVICDETTAYLFYARDDGTINMTHEPIEIFPSPDKWSAPHVTVLTESPDQTNIFEAIAIYKSRADNQYYLEVEGRGERGIRRKLSLFTALTLHGDAEGKWKLAGYQWAAGKNLSFEGGNWSFLVSHPEAIRANNTQNMEIDDINHSYWIYMGVTEQELRDNKGGYRGIPWKLGLMHNGDGPMYPSLPKAPF
jgi:hypothetical protein